MHRLTVVVWATLLLSGAYSVVAAQPPDAPGVYRHHEAAVLNASAQRKPQPPPVPWHRQALPLPTLSVVVATAVACLLRWSDIRRVWRGTPLASHEAVAAEPVPRAAAAPHQRAGPVIATVLLGGGSYLAWAGMQLIESERQSAGLWRFAVGCVVAGGALYALNRFVGCTRTLSSFTPARWKPFSPVGDRGRMTLLATGAAGSLTACMYVILNRPEQEAIAVALWFAAQIWIVAAAFPSTAADGTEHAAARRARPLVALLLIGATVTRFWQIGYYPDFVHHDHSIYGHNALQMLRGDWTPFFVRIDSIGRPWFLPTMAALKIFGHHYWVVRLTGALAGVAVVWGTYLLGTALFNRRIGLIAALLVLVNNDLLLYSRQPYVLDPVAPFVLALYGVVIGLQRGSRFHWCLAGILSGWALIMYWVSSIFPIIGVVIMLYLCAIDPRRIWAQRAGLLWFVAAALAVYLPMVPDLLHTQDLTGRLGHTGVLFGARGWPLWDGALWAGQLLHSFGALIYYRDSAAWVVGTGQSICMPLGACLMGIGLVYLLLSWWTPATFLLIAWTIIQIFVGSAMQTSPPTMYHILVAIVAVMLISAVAVDRFLAVTERRSPQVRAAALVAVALLLAVTSFRHVDAVWAAVRRPARPDGRVVLQENQRITAARYIREHPEYRYYLVRSPLEPDTTCADVLYEFFIDDSDVSDLTAALASILPVPPVEPAVGAAFIVFPRRAAELANLAAVYPRARVEELLYAEGSGSMRVYTVDAQTIRETYASHHANRLPG